MRAALADLRFVAAVLAEAAVECARDLYRYLTRKET
jgi:hypothetical protein